MISILIVEDDAPLSNGIILTLREEGRQFTQCLDIESAKRELSRQSFDLAILDINLPDGNGTELCRLTGQSPVLFLTAKDTELDIVSGLEMGGDDYITKPFSLAVLRARVAALLRRRGQTHKQPDIESGRFAFDFERMVFEKDREPVDLSKTEQKLLHILVRNSGQTVSRELLSRRVWGDGTEYVDENALSVAIRRLREKLEDDPSSPECIQTVFGVGYKWSVK